MEFRSAILGSHSELQCNFGKIGHENGQNFDPRIKQIFECRLLENLTTNTKKYATLKSVSNYPSYGI